MHRLLMRGADKRLLFRVQNSLRILGIDIAVLVRYERNVQSGKI